ncbi:MAG: right-handed parallel beta-helix repeat-containing protein, partial [Phycisphaerae bacterium]|nr:right-handed parallel beta-helix repeat-containing protein [Phycisphaerae bacterium]
SGVVLRGRGPDKTHLVFNSPNTIWYGAIRMSGSKSKRTVRVLGGSERGSRKLTVESTEGLKKGQTILISRDNIPAVMYTKPQWKASWDVRAVGQILRITAISGKTIEIDTPLRLAYPKSLNPGFQILQPIERAGIEDLHIKRLDKSEDDMIGINKALNCWIRNVESESCMKSHVLIFFGRFLTIEGSYFHHAYNYSGGHGYGVDVNKHTTDCLITNNIFHDLRHSMSVCLGANGNVFSYNYSFKNTLNDVCIHGHYSYMNLFEGNIVELVKYADWWGPTGPLTTCFRNRVATEIVLYDHSHRATIVGNTIQRQIDTDSTSKDTFAEGNLIRSKMVWQKVAAGSRIPASLYLKAKPAFWGNRPWPGIGADVDAKGARMRLPAEDRYRELRRK